MSQTARRVLQNSVVRVGGYAVGAAIHFAVIVLAARYLGAQRFGSFAFILAIVGSLQLVVDMGVRNILIRDIAVDRARFAERLGVARTLLWMLSPVTLALVIVIANVLAVSDEVRHSTYLAGVAVIVTFYGLGYSAVLRAFEEMEWDILGFVLHKVIFVGLVGAAVWLDLGLRGLFGAMLAANTFLYLYYWVLVRVLHGRPRLALDVRAAWALLAESFPLGVAEILRRLTWQVDKLLLGVLATPIALGLFSAAFKFLEAMNPFTMNIALPLFPALSRLAQGSPARLLRACEQSLKFLVALGVPAAVLLFVLAHRIVELFFGHEYEEAGLILRLLAPVALLLLPISLFGFVFAALGWQRAYTGCVAASLGVKLAVELALIPAFGYVGAALGTLAGEAVLLGAGLAVLRRLGRLPVLGLTWRPAVAGLAMGGVAWLVGDAAPVVLAAGVLAAVAAYATVLVLLGTFTSQERALLVDAVRVRLGSATR